MSEEKKALRGIKEIREVHRDQKVKQVNVVRQVHRDQRAIQVNVARQVHRDQEESHPVDNC